LGGDREVCTVDPCKVCCCRVSKRRLGSRLQSVSVSACEVCFTGTRAVVVRSAAVVGRAGGEVSRNRAVQRGIRWHFGVAVEGNFLTNAGVVRLSVVR
jgi:hypothetical protein